MFEMLSTWKISNENLSNATTGFQRGYDENVEQNANKINQDRPFKWDVLLLNFFYVSSPEIKKKQSINFELGFGKINESWCYGYDLEIKQLLSQ